MRTVLHSYSLRDYPLRHVMKVAEAGGWPAIELSSFHFDTEFDAGNTRRGVATAVELGRRCGVDIHCVGYWAMFAAADGTARKHWVEKVCGVVDACVAQGITFINGAGGWLVRQTEDWNRNWRANGSAMATVEDFGRVADCYRQVAAYAADHGVRVGVEVHPNTVHDTVAATARLLDLADHDNLVVTLDPANAAVLNDADRDPAVVDLVADRVAYFHLKNCLIRDGASGFSADFTVDAAAGLVDNYRWLARMTELPRVTAVSVEYCGAGDPHPRLAAARQYLNDTLYLVSRELTEGQRRE